MRIAEFAYVPLHIITKTDLQRQSNYSTRWATDS